MNVKIPHQLDLIKGLLHLLAAERCLDFNPTWKLFFCTNMQCYDEIHKEDEYELECITDTN